jgi:hypothetical protein
VLKIASPKYKGISNLTIKCIAQKRKENRMKPNPNFIQNSFPTCY